MKETQIIVKSRINPRQKWRVDFNTIYGEGIEVVIIRRDLKMKEAKP
jgi:hypothetical protein